MMKDAIEALKDPKASIENQIEEIRKLDIALEAPDLKTKKKDDKTNSKTKKKEDKTNSLDDYDFFKGLKDPPAGGSE